MLTEETSEYFLILGPIFAFFKLVLAKLTPSLEGNPPSALPSLAFDWEQLNLIHCLLRPQSLCRVASKEFSDSSSAPSYHLGWCQVGQLEEEKQFIALSL